MTTINAGWVLALVLLEGGTSQEADKVFEALTYTPVALTPSEVGVQIKEALDKVRNG